MKKTYQSPVLEQVTVKSLPLMQVASGVHGDGAASDITYGGEDDGGKEPEAKPLSVWED